jgi:hypothetical protein
MAEVAATKEEEANDDEGGEPCPINETFAACKTMLERLPKTPRNARLSKVLSPTNAHVCWALLVYERLKAKPIDAKVKSKIHGFVEFVDSMGSNREHDTMTDF